jgi:repressor LexA
MVYYSQIKAKTEGYIVFFDKEKFAHLLKKAMGSRSINKYWLQSEVSATYISKLLRSLIDTPPGPTVIRKLANVAHNGVTYEELMEAAGHISNPLTVRDIYTNHPEKWPNVKDALKNFLDRYYTTFNRQALTSQISKKANVTSEQANSIINTFIESVQKLPDDKFIDLIDNLSPVVNFTEDSSVTIDLPLSPNFIQPQRYVKIPVVGTVCAGNGMLAFEENLGYEYADADIVKSCQTYFWLRVKGDSMTGEGIIENDLALVCQKDDVESGSLAVIIVDNEEGQIKRIIKKDNAIVLQAANPAYPAKIFVGQELSRLRIVGEVIETKRSYRKKGV